MTVIITKQSFAHRYMYGDLLLRIAIAWHDFTSIAYRMTGSLGINLLSPRSDPRPCTLCSGSYTD